MPIARYGVLNLFAQQIIFVLSVLCFLGVWDQWLSLKLGLMFLALLALFTSIKIVFFLAYFWLMPEFQKDNAAEFYSQPGFTFFVAELQGKIVACVGVQKVDDKVS